MREAIIVLATIFIFALMHGNTQLDKELAITKLKLEHVIESNTQLRDANTLHEKSLKIITKEYEECQSLNWK